MKRLIWGLAAAAASCAGQAAMAQQAEPLRLLAPLGATDSDYPRWAIDHSLGGRVVMRLEVSPEGRVSKCEVVSSSGYASLDARACEVYRTRGFFNPGAGMRVARAPFSWVPGDGGTADPLHVLGRFAGDTGIALGRPVGPLVPCEPRDATTATCRPPVTVTELWLGRNIGDGASVRIDARDRRALLVRLAIASKSRRGDADRVLRERLGAPCFAVPEQDVLGWRNGKAYVIRDSGGVSVFLAAGDPIGAQFIEQSCPPLS
ncbi:TonB family protein [Sphingomonas sp. HITSZ_GF]|uniref:energy transducer TonB n=1 Tax=Sphingomonas sp. HITSZ_GF TaxID=3037247 RepID=UPI00240E14E4|nr:TonB family protein [Sphingomonas sp. HITSZ_GF]MDG2532366.1 TonB family protein [Sphingomonas sp. HITSZ_GF]